MSSIKMNQILKTQQRVQQLAFSKFLSIVRHNGVNVSDACYVGKGGLRGERLVVAD